jgi:hypothetical protein
MRPKPDFGCCNNKNSAQATIFCTVLHKICGSPGTNIALRHSSNAKNFLGLLMFLRKYLISRFSSLFTS